VLQFIKIGLSWLVKVSFIAICWSFDATHWNNVATRFGVLSVL